MVSIYVPTYNHEKYIKQALDSILMQKTQYTYEVFVGEDCSTDNTRQVLKAWESKHPGKFNILYREENMNQKPIYNSLDLKMRCKGKYIIGLEGDDYWTDPEKLEKQVSFLESHPDYYAVAHNCTVVGEDSQPNGEKYPECKDETYTLRHFASDIMPGQLTTFLCRNYMTDEKLDNILICKKRGPGDRYIFFTAACYGKIHCIQESMSAYRHIVKGGSSYSANYVHEFEKEELPLRNRMEYAESLGHEEAILCARMQYLLYLNFAKRNGYADKNTLAEAYKRVPNKWVYIPLILKRNVNRLLRRRSPYF